MTITFAPSVNFLSQTTSTDASVSVFSIPGGRTSQSFMEGVDGNIYFPLWGFGGTASATQIACGNSGNIITISYARFVADGGLNPINNFITLPAQGTPYFWVLSLGTDPNPGHAPSYQYSGVLYRIDNDTTVTAVNTFVYDTLSINGYFSDTDVYVCQCLGNKIIFITNESKGGLSSGVEIKELSIVEGDLDPYHDKGNAVGLTTSFFNYASWTGSRHEYNSFAAISDADTLGYHFLIYISASAYTYMAANPGVSTTYANFSSPGVYTYDPNLGTFTNVTSAFGLIDIGLTHLDNTTSTDPNDDYSGLLTFMYHGVQHVMFTRSYMQTSDLFTSGVGSYVHLNVFSWDGAVATSVYDMHTGLFNSVTDVGGTPATGYPPKFILSGLVGDGMYYLWGDFNNLGYIVGKSITLSFTPDPTFGSYFSDFHDTEYNDWTSSDDTGIDFGSFITTYWVLSDDTALWMEMPWVVTYIDNTDINPSCFFTPKWDWTDADWNHHSGPSLDIYQIRSKQAVSDKRTRVRGRGRAMQLKFESSTGQPFNLLGWSLINDRNTTP